MAEMIHEYKHETVDQDGRRYRARAFAEQKGHVWAGWLEFTPVDGSGEPVRTDTETTQPNREAVVYWASGLEPVYLDGALARIR